MKLDEPLNVTERMLYGINIRLDAIIEQLNSIVEVMANQKDIAVTNNKIMQKVVKDDKIERKDKMKRKKEVK